MRKNNNARQNKSITDSTEAAYNTLRRLCHGGAQSLGINLTEAQLVQFEKLTSLLLSWNSKFNLTRITELEDIVVKHYVDSLSCLAAADIAEGALVVDVGSGAGFPGLPLAIARPDLRITFIEATGKKVRFIAEACQAVLSREPKIFSLEQECGMQALDIGECVTIVHGRAEQAGRIKAFREKFDVAVARALARMPILAEYCLPFVHVGGIVIAMKGQLIEDELREALRSISVLGGGEPSVCELVLPGTEIERRLVVIPKVKPTPSLYPRSSAEIARKRVN